MELCEKETFYLISPKIQTITERDVDVLYSKIRALKKPAVIDMGGVDDCVNAFFRMFRKCSGLSLINIDSKILSILYITGFDKYVTIYGDEVSFQDRSRALINRRFRTVN